MPFNAQDEFAKLVEDIRIGQIGRPVAIPRGTKFVPYRPNIIVDDLPVFFMEGNQPVIVEAINAAEDAIEARQFHLPYPRCAFMMSLGGDYPGLQHLDKRFHVRHTYVMVLEEDDDHLHIEPFMKNELVDHWVRQLFDIYVPFGNQLDEVMVTYDPAWGSFPADFMLGVEMSLWTRLQIVLSFIHRMMNRTDRGVATAIAGSPVAAKINARRNKMKLPTIQQVISIDLTRAVTSAPVAKGSGKGSPKKPHFRHGSWHTRKATGKRSWHPAVAVHGGGGVAPPWYEIKTPPI